MLGFLLPIRFFKALIASLGCTVFDLIRSVISRLVAMSSRLEDVAFSICSSRTEVPEVNHPAMVVGCRWQEERPEEDQEQKVSLGFSDSLYGGL